MRKNSILMAWVGQTDLDACQGKVEVGQGPIARAVEDLDFAQVVLLCNYKKKRGETYRDWLSQRCGLPIEVVSCEFDNPTDFRRIYTEADQALSQLPHDAPLAFHVSPGTPAMATVWILLAQTRCRDRARILQSSPHRGVEEVDLPFDIYAELGPELLRRSDHDLVRLTQGLPSEGGGFENIVHRCEAMQRALALARRIALRDVPVLIQGESGTGKELVAKAIHESSHRAGQPFKPVNCGTLSGDLINSELFGHRKGAFTGASADHKGLFEAAAGGTLFLDEIGELPIAAQVRLLRTLQEGKIRPVGDTQEHPVDVRIIAATHRDLLDEIPKGNFREDLFYRLGVGLVYLPPLRERRGDFGPLVDHLLQEINTAAKTQPGYQAKTVSPGARALLEQQVWPGNVRELRNVLTRASILATTEEVITEDDLRDSLFVRDHRPMGILERALGNGFRLEEVCHEVQRIYILRALQVSGGNRTKAATDLLGFKSRQNMDNLMKKIGLEI